MLQTFTIERFKNESDEYCLDYREFIINTIKAAESQNEYHRVIVNKSTLKDFEEYLKHRGLKY